MGRVSLFGAVSYRMVVSALFVLAVLLLFSSPLVSAYTIEYQEDADATGYNGTWDTVPVDHGAPKAYDADWDTYGTLELGTRGAIVYFNYTKPAGAVNLSWQVKDAATVNLTLPSDCWNKNPIVLRAESVDSALDHVEWSCKGIASWTQVRSGGAGSPNVYEEGVFWNISRPNDPSPVITSADRADQEADLTCNTTLSHDESKPMNVTVQWFRNDTLNLTVDYDNDYSDNDVFNATLLAGNLSKDDEWLCSVIVKDGTANSSWVNSSAMTILGCNPPSGAGDWEVDGTEVCRDRSINLTTGTVFVRDGDLLVLDNVNLSLDMTANSGEDIYNYAGGSFYADNGTYIREADNDNYFYFYNYAEATFNNVTVQGNNLFYLWTFANAHTYVSDSAFYYIVLRLATNNYIVLDNVTALGVQYYAYTGDDVTIRGLDMTDARTNYNITSTTSDRAINMTDVAVSDTAGFWLYNDGGTLNVENSTFYSFYHYDDPGDNSTITNSTLTYFYFEVVSLAWAVNNLTTYYTRDDDDLTRTLTSTHGENSITFDNVGMRGIMAYVPGGNFTINDSTIWHSYTYNGGISNYTNCTIIGNLFVYNIDSPHAYFQDTLFQGSTFRSYGSAPTYIYATNSNFSSTSESRFYNDVFLNFSHPGGTIDDLQLPTGDYRTTVEGYINFTSPIDDWAANHIMNRYFPFNATHDDGSAFAGRNISIKDGATFVTEGTTDANGYLLMNISTAEEGETKEFSVFVDGTNLINITMLTGTMPWGIEVGNDAPSISSVTLSTDGTNTNQSSENITAAIAGATDAQGDTIRYNHDWRRNGTSVAVLNMNFDVENQPTSGQTRDLSDYANHGTLGTGVHAPVYTATGGVNGSGAYLFDGNDTFINITNSLPALNGTDITVEAWVKGSGGTGDPWMCRDGYCAILTQYNQDYDGYYLYLDANTSGASNTRPAFWGANGGAQAESADAITPGVWHHIVGTANSTHLAIYVDGVQKATASWSDRHGVDHATYIGGDDNTNVPGRFNGTIDNVRVWNRSLSADQIKALSENRTDRLMGGETAAGDLWSDCVTPNDGYDDGDKVCSNNITILQDTTCTYIGSGDWTVDSTDGCTLDVATDVGGNDLFFSGAGTTIITAAITNWAHAILTGGAKVIGLSGGGLKE